MMTRNLNRLTILTAFCVAAGLAAPAGADVLHTGSLNSADGGLLGGGPWLDKGGSTIEWVVSRNDDGSFRYAYAIDTPKHAVSHFTLETSEGFTEEDIFNVSGPVGSLEIGWHAANPGSPNLPGPLYGVKFDDLGEMDGPTTLAFDSWRAPVWADAYAKGAGGKNLSEVWNSGFAATDAPAGHVMAPDTKTVIPEPASAALFGIGSVGMLLARRRRKA